MRPNETLETRPVWIDKLLFFSSLCLFFPLFLLWNRKTWLPLHKFEISERGWRLNHLCGNSFQVGWANVTQWLLLVPWQFLRETYFGGAALMKTGAGVIGSSTNYHVRKRYLIFRKKCRAPPIRPSIRRLPRFFPVQTLQSLRFAPSLTPD